MIGLLCSPSPFKMTSRLEMTHQYSVDWPMDYAPILRVVWLAMIGVTGQCECDEHSVVLLWNKYIAPSTKVRNCVLIPLPFFAFVAERVVGGLGCCAEDTVLKAQQLPSCFTGVS